MNVVTKAMPNSIFGSIGMIVVVRSAVHKDMAVKVMFLPGSRHRGTPPRKVTGVFTYW